MPQVARLGDVCDHGAVIITASSDTLTNNIGTARLSDLVICPIPGHDVNPIVTGAPNTVTDNLLTARVGDITACGAVIVTGSPDRIVEDGSNVEPEFEPIDGFQPWVTPAEAAAASTEDHVGNLTSNQRSLFAKAGIDPDQKNPNPPEADEKPADPPKNDVVPTDCTDIHELQKFEPSFKLSTNFVLAHLSSATVLEKATVQAQSGLTIQQIVCNLRGVAVNVLEPLTAKYGRPTINCGFRSATASYGSPTSEHKLGQAVDLQWPGLSDQEYYDRACWIRDNLQWSQVILEWGGNRPWIHVSFHPSKVNRTNLLSRITVANGYQKGLILCKNVPKVGGVKV